MKRISLVMVGIAWSASAFLMQTSYADPILSSTPRTSASIPWSEKMVKLYKTLADLLTDVTSDSRFQNPANKKRIQNEVNQLASLAHDLSKKSMIKGDADPTLPLIAGLLSRETLRASIELKNDNRAYARSILRTVPGYCMACHTRNATGPQFAQLKLEPSGASLTPIERGEFFVASRQFDRAQQEFIGVIKDPNVASLNSFAWEKAVRHSLNIAVRVKQDPEQASDIVEAVLSTQGAPVSIIEDAQAWKSSIQKWKEEPSRKTMTEEGLYIEAITLMEKARQFQKYPMDRTADILYLRASAAAHNLLQSATSAVKQADGLFLAGVSYEILSPLKTEDLHDLFYEACIRRAPHTPTAEACYRRFEQSTYFGYTGSGGTRVPDDVRKNLKELKSLSQPLASEKSKVQG